MNLSPHFTLKELCKSQTASRFNLDNLPTDEHIENLKYLCETILEPVREKYGPFTPTSGYRSKDGCMSALKKKGAENLVWPMTEVSTHT